MEARTCQGLAHRKEEQVHWVVACKGTAGGHSGGSSEQEAHKVLLLLADGARVRLEFGG